MYDLYSNNICESYNFNYGISNMILNFVNGVIKQNNFSRYFSKTRIIRAMWIIFLFIVLFINRNLKGFVNIINNNLWDFAKLVFMKLFADVLVSIKYWVFWILWLLRILVLKSNFFFFYSSVSHSHKNKDTVINSIFGSSSSLILIRIYFNIFLTAISSESFIFPIIVVHKWEAHLQ